MSYQFESNGRVVWDVSTDVARCFLSQVRSVEELCQADTGIGKVISDTVQIDLRQVTEFLKLAPRLLNLDHRS